jgi:predicted ATPase/DNA-binding winged helix-turn-helix (wHTH) protein
MSGATQLTRASRPTADKGDEILFGDFHLLPTARILLRDGSPVNLGDRALDILIALVERAGQVVSNAELFAIVWPHTSIDPSALRVHMAALRKALGQGEAGSRFIISVRGRGYSFVAKIQRTLVGREVIVFPDSAVPNDRDYAPVPLVGIIGRDEAVSEIADQLLRKRLVTITGAGGIGKTAVALAIVQKLEKTFRDGVKLVDVASLTSPNFVAAHLASLLRLPAPDPQPLQYVIAHLRTQNMLIVFDNCEHVIEAVSETAEAILQGAPEVHILTTSREPLRAMGEWIKRLVPLAVPPPSSKLTVAEVLQFSAVQLFMERALACDGSSELTDAYAPVVAEICTKLDGLPLAIELAATRAPLFGLRGLLDRLDNRFRILTKGRRTALPRHQTLSAMIDWSYEALSEEEKIAWRHLAVFPALFTIEAAEAVGKVRPSENFSIVDIMYSLVEKSMVSVDSHGGEGKYRLLESLRLYALNKLLENNEAECVRRRHAQYWYERSMGFGGDWTETTTPEWLAEHSGDIADIRAALEWALARGGDSVLGIRFVGASAQLWFKMLLLPELRRYLGQAIQVAPRFPEIDDHTMIRLHLALANSIVHAPGASSGIREALNAALAIAERRGDVNSQIQIIWTHWGVSCIYGDYLGMVPWLERVRIILVRSPELPIGPLYDRMAALTYHQLGEQQTALRHAERALQHSAVMRRTGHDGVFVYDHKIAASLHHSRILWMCGFSERALEVIHDTSADTSAAKQSFAFGFFLAYAAFPISFWTGDLAGARRHLSTLLDVEAGITFNVWQMAARLYERVLEFLNATDQQRSAVREKLVNDISLTTLQADSLCTFNSKLLCPQLLARTTDRGIHWSTAEILRAKGEVLLDAGSVAAWPEAEELFLRSIEISRRQGALSWELRSATSLARLWHHADRIAQARDLLTEVYGRFTEGFATRDLVEAKTLLDSLQ